MELDSPVERLAFVGPSYKKRLDKLEIKTIGDLLHHIPRRYLDFSTASAISLAKIGETVTVAGEISFIKNQYTKSAKKIQIAELVDESGKVKVVWFNQPYLLNSLKKGDKLAVAGELGWFGREKAFITPEYELMNNKKKGVHTGRLIPVYPETAGISSKWLRARITDALTKTNLGNLEFINNEYLDKNGMQFYDTALKKVHFPDNINEAISARTRLAFNELMKFQMQNMIKKHEFAKYKTVYNIKINKKLYKEFIERLPFELTQSQKRSIDEILEDIEGNTPMNRLLEGDVGSGKTIVAAAASYLLADIGLKSIFMAPTQILAEQHYNTLNTIFDKKLKVKLTTSSKQKGEEDWDILVGTHSVLFSKKPIKSVALVVVDEQHRFGVEQRESLRELTSKDGESVHILSMTATPIPRTVALTAYGDMDLSTLDTLPAGRKKITTWIVPPTKRKNAYGWIREQIINDGVQVYVVCPLIEESETDILALVKSAKNEYEKLSKIFPDLSVGLLHGRQKIKEKDKVLKGFKEKKIDILVSTPVIEVGIDIPNASIIIIESADRFGLAQLHQLRGRVGRGETKSFCLLFSEAEKGKALTRLEALKSSTSGFELAEMDLKIRGPGEIFGARQSGFPELKITSWSDIELIKKTKKLAEDVFTDKKYVGMLNYYQEKIKAPV